MKNNYDFFTVDVSEDDENSINDVWLMLEDIGQYVEIYIEKHPYLFDENDLKAYLENIYKVQKFLDKLSDGKLDISPLIN